MAVQSRSTSLPPRQRDNPRVLRGLFSVLIGFLLLVYCAAVVQQWHQTVRDAQTSLVYMRSILVQSTRATLTNHELILRGLGSELVACFRAKPDFLCEGRGRIARVLNTRMRPERAGARP